MLQILKKHSYIHFINLQFLFYFEPESVLALPLNALTATFFVEYLFPTSDCLVSAAAPAFAAGDCDGNGGTGDDGDVFVVDVVDDVVEEELLRREELDDGEDEVVVVFGDEVLRPSILIAFPVNGLNFFDSSSC